MVQQGKVAKALKRMAGKAAFRMISGIMGGNLAAMRLQRHKEFFHHTVDCFEEQDGPFKPRSNMLSVTGQIHHVTGGIELFLSGLVLSLDRFNGIQLVSRRAPAAQWIGLKEGFSNLAWTALSNKDADATTYPQSFENALRGFDETIDLAADIFGQLTPEELVLPLSENPMGIKNPMYVLEMLIDHTAHHRGALAQYARLLGKEPNFPYFKLSESAHEAQFM
ncbi:MAG: DinB family protein [Candidatus Obscuribacterales bacterium]|nr:DinB family protein [Steroidobacteraceae bacterium]